MREAIDYTKVGSVNTIIVKNAKGGSGGFLWNMDIQEYFSVGIGGIDNR
jgi:hypothetical protein